MHATMTMDRAIYFVRDPSVALDEATYVAAGQLGYRRHGLRAYLDCDLEREGYSERAALTAARTCARYHLSGHLRAAYLDALVVPRLADAVRRDSQPWAMQESFLVADLQRGDRHLPVLGAPNFVDLAGFGLIRPTDVSFGGDEGSFTDHIHWVTWGGRRAIGYGQAWMLKPHAKGMTQGSMQPDEVVAYRRGTCDGHHAYRAIQWFFPQLGGRFRPHHDDRTTLCNPTFHR